jgi:hypothetical protein
VWDNLYCKNAHPDRWNIPSEYYPILNHVKLVSVVTGMRIMKESFENPTFCNELSILVKKYLPDVKFAPDVLRDTKHEIQRLKDLQHQEHIGQ